MSEMIFTRPGRKCEIKEKLIEDIKNTKFRIYMAMFSFTDRDIYNAMHQSVAHNALFILNKGDINEEKRSCSFDLVEKYNIHTVILGDNKFSKMHHKFIILDNIAYIGSYNFSYPASNQNWEFMIRITDPLEVKKIEEEFWGMWLLGNSNILTGNKCNNCHTQIEEIQDHFTMHIDYNSFLEVNDPKKYVKKSCIPLKGTCSVCKISNARVTMNKGEASNKYCIKCAGNELNKKFIDIQVFWESDNIYYEELAYWNKDTLGEDLLGKCGSCNLMKPLILLNEITRGRGNSNNPYGIEIGKLKNICEDCYYKDFQTAYIIDEIN